MKLSTAEGPPNLTASEDSFEAFGGLLGASWEPLGELLGIFWGVLERSEAHFGAYTLKRGGGHFGGHF